MKKGSCSSIRSQRKVDENDKRVKFGCNSGWESQEEEDGEDMVETFE